MTLRLNGSTSGYTEIDAPAVAGNNTLVFPGGNGSADQVIGGNGSGTLSWVDRTRTTLASSVASTSGTAIDFTGIPSWVKRVTVMFSGVSTNGTSVVLIQIGAGSFTTSGYSSTGWGSSGSSLGNVGFTNGFPTTDAGELASFERHGIATISALGSNTWVFSSTLRRGSGVIGCGAGGVTLSGTLDRIRITTVNGTDTFDAGSINIMYEG